VKPNRSIPSPVVIPVLIYPDVRDAVAWLGAAFGFVERLQIGPERGGGPLVVIGDPDSARERDESSVARELRPHARSNTALTVTRRTPKH
jgi:hypothetical protein